MNRHTRKKKLIGGKTIASGGYGCVFNPALKCKNKPERELNKISKLMSKKHALQEYQEIFSIKKYLKNIPNFEDYFLIYDVTLCFPDKLTKNDLQKYNNKCTALPKYNITKKNINTKIDQMMSLNLPNGGIPIDDYIYSNGSFYKIYNLHNKLVNLLKNGIIPMNNYNIYHCDIKDSNVLIDENGKTRLIDWGLSVKYKPTNTSIFPKNWRNRPLQFNVPFTIIIFTDDFYEKYTDYLNKKNIHHSNQLKPFVIDYLNFWIKKRGPGHYKFINEIFYMLHSNEFNSIYKKDLSKIIETEITIPTIVNSIVSVLEHYTKFKDDGTLNLREYLNDVFVKTIDIWGFITIYFPLLELFYNNYNILSENEMTTFNKLKYIFNEYLYNPIYSYTVINTNKLFSDLKELGKLIYKLKQPFISFNSNSNTNNTYTNYLSSLSYGGKTKKNINKKFIFKRKKMIKNFKNAFFLSLK